MNDAGYGPVLRMVFEFSKERPFISGNHTRIPIVRGGRASIVKTSAAKKQADAVSKEAALAVLEQNWAMPDYVRVDMTAVNIDADRDNATKIVFDALEGLAFTNDRRIKTGDITLMRDKGPSRIIVAIQAIDGKAFGFPKPSKKRSPNV